MLKRFSLKTALVYISHESCFFFLLFPFLIDNNVKEVQIIYLFFIQKIAKLITEIPSGIIFDLSNPKIIFFSSKIIKLTGIMLIYYFTNIYNLEILGFTLIGISQAFFVSKIETYIYNTLEQYKKLGLFKKSVAMFYLFADISYALMPMIGGLICKKYNYRTVFYTTIIVDVISILLIVFLPKYIKNKTNQIASFKELKNKLKNISSDRLTFNLIIRLAILNGIVWQFLDFIIIYSKNQINTNFNISILSFLINSCMTIGCIYAFYFKNLFSLKNNTFLFIIMLTIMTIASYLNLFYFLIIILCFLMFFYTNNEIQIAQEIDKKTQNNARGLLFSIISIISTFYQSLNLLIFKNLIKLNINIPKSLSVVIFLSAFLFFATNINKERIRGINKN